MGLLLLSQLDVGQDLIVFVNVSDINITALVVNTNQNSTAIASLSDIKLDTLTAVTVLSEEIFANTFVSNITISPLAIVLLTERKWVEQLTASTIWSKQIKSD